MKINEKTVAELWSAQENGAVYKWKDNRIELIYPGRPKNAGGDFEDAVFKINGIRHTGKVELHVKAGDWYTHRHNLDKKYNDILLHVVYCSNGGDTVTNEGKIIPTILLDIYAWKRRKIQKNSRLRYKKTSFRCPATDMYPESKIREIIINEGQNRFNNKASSIKTYFKTENPENVLYRFLARSFGYSANSIPFEKLTGIFPLEYVRDSVSRQNRKLLLAEILSASGLMPYQRNRINRNKLPDGESILLDNLDIKNNRTNRLYESDWKFYPVRPQNNPVRRLVAFSEIMYALMERGFIPYIISVLDKMPEKKSAQSVYQIFHINHSDDYWESHFDFGVETNKKIKLLGHEKIAEIIVNTLLPFMHIYGLEYQKMEIGNKSKLLYLTFPAGDENRITRYMRGLINYDEVNKSVEQQGLIQIYNDYCKSKLCEICPLGIRKN